MLRLQAFSRPAPGTFPGLQIFLANDQVSWPTTFILDACTRRVVGWSMATHLRTELVVDALQMAIARRKLAPGLVHHSDRGVQYTSLSFGKRLEAEGLLPSMGRVGSAYDNALAESFVATLKTESCTGKSENHPNFSRPRATC